MKHWLNFGVAGAMLASLPALALAQTTTPQSEPPQTMPQQMQQRGTQQQQNTPSQASSGAAQAEISTAHAHALMAQGARSIDKVHEHLHHVINCLEGPSGADFDSQAGNPCQGKGRGALPDSTGNPSRQSHLHQAVSQAKRGLKANNLQAAQQDASRVAQMLQMRSSRGMH